VELAIFLFTRRVLAFFRVNPAKCYNQPDFFYPERLFWSIIGSTSGEPGETGRGGAKKIKKIGEFSFQGILQPTTELGKTSDEARRETGHTHTTRTTHTPHDTTRTYPLISPRLSPHRWLREVGPPGHLRRWNTRGTYHIEEKTGRHTHTTQQEQPNYLFLN